MYLRGTIFIGPEPSTFYSNPPPPRAPPHKIPTLNPARTFPLGSLHLPELGHFCFEVPRVQKIAEWKANGGLSRAILGLGLSSYGIKACPADCSKKYALVKFKAKSIAQHGSKNHRALVAQPERSSSVSTSYELRAALQPPKACAPEHVCVPFYVSCYAKRCRMHFKGSGFRVKRICIIQFLGLASYLKPGPYASFLHLGHSILGNLPCADPFPEP